MQEGKPVSLAAERAADPGLAERNKAIKADLDRVVHEGASEQLRDLEVDFDADHYERSLRKTPIRLRVGGKVYERQRYATAKYLEFTTRRMKPDGKGSFGMNVDPSDMDEWSRVVLGDEIVDATLAAGMSATALQKLMEYVVTVWERGGVEKETGGNGQTHA